MTAVIRPLTPGDVPAVAALVRAHWEGWDLDERSLAGLMLDHPWADEELPSLVAEEGGEIVGFVGVQARRMRMDGRSIRGVCCTHAVVAPDRRGGAVGALLLGRVLKGPQDVTWADSATDTVARVYGIFGGDVDHVRSCDWMLVLRPVRWARGIVAGSVRREPDSRLDLRSRRRRPRAGRRPAAPGACVPGSRSGPWRGGRVGREDRRARGRRQRAPPRLGRPRRGAAVTSLPPRRDVGRAARSPSRLPRRSSRGLVRLPSAPGRSEPRALPLRASSARSTASSANCSHTRASREARWSPGERSRISTPRSPAASPCWGTPGSRPSERRTRSLRRRWPRAPRS